MNPMQILQNFMGKGGNPQQLVQRAMGNNSNPMITNLLSMAQNGNQKGIEQFARNVCKERGINYDEEFPKFMALLTNGSFAKQHK